MRRWIFLLPLVTLAAACFAPWAVAAELRFSAQFADGSRLEGAELHDWHTPASQPRLDSRLLFDPSNPIRWVQDNTLGVTELPEAFVEFQGGDRLPGRATAFRTGTESPYHVQFPHLLFEVDVPLGIPQKPQPRDVRILTRWLQRVVWQRREDARYRPGTLFYRDGRHVEYRAVRWAAGGVRLLLEQETREVPLTQIAELHLPRQDAWDAYYEQLATLTPEATGLVMQLDTEHGVRVTASVERFQSTSLGNEPSRWVHLVQPVWCLDPLSLPHRSIRMRRYFRPYEVPLTAIDPARSVERSNLGGGWSWKRNRNVSGAPLRSGGQPFGWGLGVHAFSELEFLLPPLSRVFQTEFGLDSEAGSGGCVRASVYVGPVSGTPLFHSKHVVGSQEVSSTGPLALPAASSGERRLTLVVDPAIQDRPAGADPLEIRDTFDWLQPLIELDPALLKPELQRRAGKTIAAWQDWTLSTPETGPVLLVHTWNEPRGQPLTCVQETAPQQAFFGLSRRVKVTSEQRLLALTVSAGGGRESVPSRIQVRVDHRAIAEFEVPARRPGVAPDPVLVPLDAYLGKSVVLEVVTMGDGQRSLVEWRGLSLIARDPSLRALFVDDAEFVSELNEGAGVAEVTSLRAYAGTHAVSVTAGTRGSPSLAGWELPIRRNPSVGEFRYLRFAWRKEGGGQIGMQLADNGKWGDGAGTKRDPQRALRYATGRPKSGPPGTIMLAANAPDDWQVTTRDLAADFGEFELTGLRLECPDGEVALFDQILLARRPEDLTDPRNIPQKDTGELPGDIQAELLSRTSDPSRFGELLADVAPGFFIAESGGGLWLLKGFNGKDKVLRTGPSSGNKPGVLRAAAAIPQGKKTQLLLSLSHHPKEQWHLTVKAGGETLHELDIGEQTVKDGWVDVRVDLSKFAGSNVVLELLVAARGRSTESAFWSRAEVISE